jgi:hypothetical protein
VTIGEPVTYSPQQEPDAITADLAKHVRAL